MYHSAVMGFPKTRLLAREETDLHMSPRREFCQLYFEPSVVQERHIYQNDPNCGCLGMLTEIS